jgi:hypothetical protein
MERETHVDLDPEGRLRQGTISWRAVVQASLTALSSRRKFTTYNPDVNPPVRGEHGLSKLDWVTVWFLGLNSNTT